MKMLSISKDRKKIFRSIIQFIILFSILVGILYALFAFQEYEPYNVNDSEIVTGEDKGFIAVSYVAVDREGSPTMISTKRLEEHFDALNKNGYVTITQEDIINYYKKGTPLPEKALFLMFEDGRRDTAIFSEKLMQEYNFKGTMLSYVDKFDNQDAKFLLPKDLEDLVKNSYWELGTNGYRLSYINVFDRYDRYLGELTSLEYAELRKYLDRDYNQYLMDYIRDEDGIPKESYQEMKERISNDYQLMKNIYGTELGYLPSLYVLMHSNTGSFANNEKASEVNGEWITNLFKMNFNREGETFNNRENDIYDLTRMQPQAYWYPNHLLMRISDDTKEKITFVDGDLDRKADWETIEGAAQFSESTIALTSEPERNGLIKLKDSEKFKNLSLSVILKGNKLGTQTVYLRADEELKNYVSIKLQNNFLYIVENSSIIFELDLNQHDGTVFQTIEENMAESLKVEEDTYEKGINLWGEVITRMKEPADSEKKTLETGQEYEKDTTGEYKPRIQINEPGNRQLYILLENDTITVLVDGKEAVNQLKLISTSKGSVYLESAWGEYGYSQRNIADNVYDGVFENLLIKNTDQDEKILYHNKLEGFDKVLSDLENGWNNLINWFIENL